MAFVLCVWAVCKATCPPTQAASYAMMSVYHKASAAEGGDEGVTWWTRACRSDREAIVLLKSEDAETLLHNAARNHRPPKPRAPPLLSLIHI